MSDVMRKLAGQTVIYGISTMLGKFLNFLLTPYLTRKLCEVDYGVVTHFYAIIPFLLVVLTMGLESGFFRFSGKASDEAEKKRVFATAWGTVGLAAVAFFIAVLCFNKPIARAMTYEDYPSYIWITAAIITVDALAALPFARLREQGRSIMYVGLRLLSVVVNVLLCLFFFGALPSLADTAALGWLYRPDMGPGYVLIANLVASVVTLLCLLPLNRGIVPRIDSRTARTMLLYSLPLLLSGIAGTANEFIDRQMLLWLLPGSPEEAKAQLGIYGAVLKLGVVMTLFTSMYRLAAEPFFLAEFKKEDFLKANAQALKYFIIVSIMIFLVIAFYRDVVLLLLGRTFRQGGEILPVVLLSNMFSGIVLNLSFWYKQTGATKYALYVTCTGLVFTVVFNIMLVPVFGYVGAAVARLICEFSMVVVSYFLNRRHYPVPYDMKGIGLYFLLGAALYGIGLACGGAAVWARYLIYFALVVIFAVYAVRREGIDVAGLLKSVLRRR